MRATPFAVIAILCSACVGLDGLTGPSGSSAEVPHHAVLSEEQPPPQGPEGDPTWNDAGEFLSGTTLDGGDAAAQPQRPPDAGLVDAGDAGRADAAAALPPQDAGDPVLAACAELPPEAEPNDPARAGRLSEPGVCGALSAAGDIDAFEFDASITVLRFYAQGDATITVSAQGQSKTLAAPAIVTGTFTTTVTYRVEVRSPTAARQTYVVYR